MTAWHRFASLLAIPLLVLVLGACDDSVVEPDPDLTYAVPAIGHQKGPDDALVTLIEISDFQCSFCKEATSTVDQVLKQYGDNVRVLFVSFPLPRHDRAIPAAVAAECAAEQDSFWPYHDLLFANQYELDDRSLRSYAGRAGLTLSSWLQCIEQDPPRDRIIERQGRLTSFGVSVTPSFFINGRYLRGSQALEVFEELIDELLATAQQAVADGADPSEYYEAEIVGKGVTP